MKNMKPHARRNPSRTGFTLIELLLVVAIIAILAAIALPKFTGRTKEAKISAAHAGIDNISTAIRMFELDTGDFPASVSEIVAESSSKNGYKGPYLEKGMPKDPWGHDYIYVTPGARNKRGFDLSSLGPDGVESDDDITNWASAEAKAP